MQPADGRLVADLGAIGANEGIALAAPDTANGERVLVAELEPVVFGEFRDRGLRLGLFGGGFWQLTEHFRQRNGRIGGSGPGSLEILLIHHCCSRLAPLLSGNADYCGLVPGWPAPAPGRPFRG